jgi:hypothetical protein
LRRRDTGIDRVGAGLRSQLRRNLDARRPYVEICGVRDEARETEEEQREPEREDDQGLATLTRVSVACPLRRHCRNGGGTASAWACSVGVQNTPHASGVFAKSRDAEALHVTTSRPDGGLSVRST